MKKILHIFACLIIVFCSFFFVSCGDADNKSNQEPPNTPNQEDNLGNNGNQNENDLISYSQIMNDVVDSVVEFFETNTDLEPQMQSEYNSSVHSQLMMIKKISEMNNKSGIYLSSLEKNSVSGQANKVERFIITTTKQNNLYNIDIKILFTIKNEKISQYKKSYFVCEYSIAYFGDTKEFNLQLGYQNSRNLINQNGRIDVDNYSTSDYYFNVSRHNSITYNLIHFDIGSDNVDSSYGNGNENIFISKVTSFIYVFDNMVVEDIMFFKNGINSIVDIFNSHNELVDSLLSIDGTNMEINSDLSSMLVEFAL